jgi:MFS family permease
LRHRNYRLYFTGNLVTQIGGWLQQIAQGWLVFQLTGSPFYLGVVSFANSLPVMLLSLNAGVVVDRFPRRTVLLLTQTSMMVLSLVLSALVFGEIVQPWHIVVLSFLTGIANAFDGTARQAFVKDMVGKADMANAIALNSAVFNSSRIVGPALAGILIASVGPAWCFLLRGLSILAVIIGMARMNLAPFTPPPRAASVWGAIREGLDYIRHNETVRTLIAIISITNLFCFPYTTLLPAYASEVLRATPQEYGLMSTMTGIGALTAALVVASLGHSKRKGVLVTIGNIGFPLFLIALSFSQALPLSLGLLIFSGFSFMVQSSTANTLVQSTVPDHLRGRVMSVYMLSFFGLSPLGSLQAGFIAEHWGVPAGIGVGALVALLCSLYVVWRVPRVRRLE